MSLSASNTANSVLARLTTDFQRNVFKAALQSFDHKDNPLRLNNFATALRELSRIHLHDSAPDDKLKTCDWFEQKFNDLGKPTIERAQRAKYAIQGELHDDFVRDTLGIKIEETIDDYKKLINRLSEYTHISEKTFDVPADEAETLAIEALEIFDDLFQLIEDRRNGLRRNATDKAKGVLQDELMSDVVEALDELATHYNINGVDIEQLEIVSLDPHTIKYRGSGSVDCRLQYGSDSDVKRDDGAVMYDSYPLTCGFEADTSAPLEISIVPRTLDVDTSRFYENGDEDSDG